MYYVYEHMREAFGHGVLRYAMWRLEIPWEHASYAPLKRLFALVAYIQVCLSDLVY